MVRSLIKIVSERGSGGGPAAWRDSRSGEQRRARAARRGARRRQRATGNRVEQRRGGALPDRLIPDETQQQWTLGCDVDEARRRDGLLAEKEGNFRDMATDSLPEPYLGLLDLGRGREDIDGMGGRIGAPTLRWRSRRSPVRRGGAQPAGLDRQSGDSAAANRSGGPSAWTRWARCGDDDEERGSERATAARARARKERRAERQQEWRGGGGSAWRRATRERRGATARWRVAGPIDPDETQQQWTLGCDVDEARRRDGLLA
ncbi:hypothetical protein Scep_014263 [Stephania cephalantha]|uniref:Uncharacterized protein n=1 Tax=Stephania cephalantha TaxID=152367 RepID=A0AAP0J2Z1_9MAGN